jgi:EAL domain-containing protein (putative c-di-GMP-specific phosphodiesterase class I)
MAGREDDDVPDHIMDAADAAAHAARDAEAVAASAAGTAEAAGVAEADVHALAALTREVTADVVTAAALEVARTAARVAAGVARQAQARAADVAATAVTTASHVAAHRPAGVSPAEADQQAETVAAGVAEEARTQARLTDEAARTVARSVADAAASVAMAAATAADTVEAAADEVKSSTQAVAGSSDVTRAASDVAVQSVARVMDLALRRVALLRRAPLLLELERAIERDELRLHYQPVVDLFTSRTVAVEALLRWQHPKRGLLVPAHFLDVAEGPQLVNRVGDWVLEAAVQQAVRWRDTLGDEAPRTWVNISCDQLGRRHLAALVEERLAATGLAPGALGLEVTERQLARRVDDVAAELGALHELGVALAVDDFGTGYASLDYLRRFDFDELKIDRSFVSGLQDRTDRAVTASIIALGRSLDLVVVAEGIETETQREQVTQLGCAVGQGYLFHRPAPAEDLYEDLAPA